MRDEHPEDISVSRAISVVLDRHPELRYLTDLRILCAFTEALSFILELQLTEFSAGKRDLPMKCYNGLYAEWKLGLLLMQI